MGNVFGAGTRRDNLRFISARDATQLAYNKWFSLGYGADALQDPALQEVARRICAELTMALLAANQNART